MDGRVQEAAESELSDAGVARLQRDGVGPRFGTICDGIVVGKLGMSISSLMVGNTDGCVMNLRFDGVIDALSTPCPPGRRSPFTPSPVPCSDTKLRIPDENRVCSTVVGRLGRSFAITHVNRPLSCTQTQHRQ